MAAGRIILDLGVASGAVEVDFEIEALPPSCGPCSVNEKCDDGTCVDTLMHESTRMAGHSVHYTVCMYASIPTLP